MAAVDAERSSAVAAATTTQSGGRHGVPPAYHQHNDAEHHGPQQHDTETAATTAGTKLPLKFATVVAECYCHCVVLTCVASAGVDVRSRHASHYNGGGQTGLTCRGVLRGKDVLRGRIVIGDWKRDKIKRPNLKFRNPRKYWLNYVYIFLIYTITTGESSSTFMYISGVLTGGI